MLGGRSVETGVGVLDKAMAILRACASSDEGLAPREASERTGLPLPTTYRLLAALAEHGMLERDGVRYRLGIELLHLGARVAEGFDLRRQVLPHLKWLNETTGENAELYVRRQECRVPIEILHSSKGLRPVMQLGAAMPLHQGAAGRVLVAWLPDAERDGLIEASARRFSGGEPYDARNLRERLGRARLEGWAVSEGERLSGAASIAAPIFDAGGTVAGAIGLSAPALRLTSEQRRVFAPLVREAARRASSALGYVAEPAPAVDEAV